MCQCDQIGCNIALLEALGKLDFRKTIWTTLKRDSIL